MRSSIHLFACAFAVMSMAGGARAQESSGSVYVAAGLNLSSQRGPSGDADVGTYVVAPGGTTPGWTIGAGMFATPLVSVEGEVARTGMMTAREPSRYDITYNEDRRELFVGANVRFHVAAGQHFDLEPVVGFAAIDHQGWTAAERCILCNTPQQRVVTDPRTAIERLPWSASLTAGLDLRAGGRHLAFIPSLRFRTRLNNDDHVDVISNYPGSGLPKLTVSFGFSGRIGF